MSTGQDTSTPTRPSDRDPAVIRAVVEKLTKPILAWLRDGDSLDDEGDSLEGLERVLSNAYDWDGYRLAQDLDRAGWCPDAALVEILSDAEHLRYEAHKKAVAAWSQANGLTPKYAVGQRVRFRTFHHGPQEGEIVGVDAGQLRYTVFVAAMGHVRRGAGDGTLGIVLEEDKLQPLPEEQAAGGAK